MRKCREKFVLRAIRSFGFRTFFLFEKMLDPALPRSAAATATIERSSFEALRSPFKVIEAR
jgi:hypothetical protein